MLTISFVHECRFQSMVGVVQKKTTCIQSTMSNIASNHAAWKDCLDDLNKVLSKDVSKLEQELTK